MVLPIMFLALLAADVKCSGFIFLTVLTPALPTEDILLHAILCENDNFGLSQLNALLLLEKIQHTSYETCASYETCDFFCVAFPCVFFYCVSFYCVFFFYISFYS